MKNFISAASASALRNPLFVDCRWSLKEPTTYGPQEYAKGHLPGALFADVDSDLAAAPTPLSGRHPLPPLPSFAGWLQAKGIVTARPVVCYDDHGGSVAARLWWMLRAVGHTDVRILDGGIQGWQGAGLPVDTAEPTIVPGKLDGVPARWEDGHMPVISIEQMVANLTPAAAGGAPPPLVVDARPAPRFQSHAPVWPDAVAGHYPGAANWPWTENLTPDRRLRPLADLRLVANAALRGRPLREAVFHCGSGVTACFNIAVAEELGLGIPALYVGSWSEWAVRHPDKVALA